MKKSFEHEPALAGVPAAEAVPVPAEKRVTREIMRSKHLRSQGSFSELGGNIVEESDDGFERKEIVRFPEDIFVGSEDRQRKLEQLCETGGLTKDELGEKLHSVPLPSERVFTRGGDGGIAASRDFRYQQTPDGRLHTIRAYTARMDRGRFGGSEVRESTEEQRRISPEGRVTENRRTCKQADGHAEEELERLAYDAHGNVIAKEYSRSVDGKIVFATETAIDENNQGRTKTVVRVDEGRGMFHGRPGDIIKHGDAEDLQRIFSSEILKILED